MARQIRVDHCYDVTCAVCARHLSTDYECGVAMSPKQARHWAKMKGWECAPDGTPICPQCVVKTIEELYGGGKQ